MKFKMRLNPFYSANDGGGGGESTPTKTVEDAVNDTGGAPEETADGKKGEGAAGTTPQKVTFTPEQQAQVDAIVADRLAREKRKQSEAEEAVRIAAEEKALIESGKYKDLAEARAKELERLHAERLDAKREALLLKAGYDAAQVERYKKFLVGKTDEELEATVDGLKEDIPPRAKFVDPTPGNGGRQQPPPEDETEIGRAAYKRLKEKRNFRRR